MKWMAMVAVLALGIGLIAPAAYAQDGPSEPSPWDYYWAESAGGAGMTFVGGLLFSLFITDICPEANTCDYATNVLMFTLGLAYFIEPGLGTMLVGGMNNVRGNWLLSMLFGSAGLGFGSAMDFMLFENTGLRFPIFGPIFGGMAAALGYNIGAEIVEP